MSAGKKLLLSMLDEAFDRPAWHGPNLVGSLRGVSPEEAAWRPAPGRNSIWAITLHCGYWKSLVRRRLGVDPDDRFPRPGRDWPALPERLGEAAWRADLRLLKAEHRRLREAVERLTPEALHSRPTGRKRLRLEHVRGIAAHDVYHAGQIRLLRRLFADTAG